LLLSSCQPTPEDAVVIGKNGDFGQKIMQTAEPEPSGEPEDGQQKWQETLDFQSGVQVVIDANIEVPQVKAYPVYEVRPHEVTLEEAKTFADFFLKGQPLYEYKYVRTKADIETDIMMLKASLEDAKNSTTDGSEEIHQMNIDFCTDELNKYEEEYAKAPEKAPEPKPAKIEFVEDKIPNSPFSKTMRLEAFLDSNVPSYFSIFIYKDHESHMNYYYNIPITYQLINRYVWSFHVMDTLLGLSITKQGAQTKADELLGELGLKDYRLEWTEAKAELDPSNGAIPSASEVASNPDLKKCFVFHYSRMVDGISTINTEPCYGMESESDPQYDKPWSPEKIIINVNDSGVVGFNWNSPGDIIRKINDNVKIMDFEDIKEIFRKQMFYQRTWANPGTKNNKITVKSIKLNMMRVKNKDDGTYLLMPVWDFIGDWTRTEGTRDIATEYVSFLTLNAVDGSVIDRLRGY
jgi:hypothetical protein